MTALNLRRDHLSLIARTHVKYSIRGGAGLVFTFVALLTGLIVASIFITPLEELAKHTDMPADLLVEEVVDEIGLPAIQWVLGASGEQASYLVQQKPALVSAFLLVMMLIMPFVLSLGAFNQLSGDIASRGLRYLLFRTERANLFLGRFLGTYVFTLLVLAVILAIVTLYLVAKARFYGAGEVITWMLQGYVALAIYSLPYVALYAWISAAIASPFGSLVIGQLTVGFPPLLLLLASSMQPVAKHGMYLMPWGYKYWLLHPSVPRILAATLILLGFTAVLLWLGLRHFQRRDL